MTHLPARAWTQILAMKHGMELAAALPRWREEHRRRFGNVMSDLYYLYEALYDAQFGLRFPSSVSSDYEHDWIPPPSGVVAVISDPMLYNAWVWEE